MQNMVPSVDVLIRGANVDKVYEYKTIILKNNLKFSEQVVEENAQYIIRWKFNLKGASVEIPKGCVLDFRGGSLDNGTLVGNNTIISATPAKIFGNNLNFEGSFNVEESYPEWFGAKGDGNQDDTFFIQKSLDFMEANGGGITQLGPHTYKVTSIELKVRSGIRGKGQGATIIKSEYVPDTLVDTGIIVYPINIGLASISDMTILGTEKQQNGITVIRKEYDGSSPLAGAWGINEVKDYIPTKQAYKDSIISNVYVSRCHYGILLDGECYRLSLLMCDVKFCNYGIRFNITDSSIHECYIENCSYDGLIIENSNNKISNIKSIWNGGEDPLNCYGIKITGNRNCISNCEVQDNSCSGIYIGGIDNTLNNINANGNGIAPSSDVASVANVDGEGLAEWVVDTDSAIFSGCIATNYTNRENKPKYPILYKKPCIQSGTSIDIVGARSRIVATHPIYPDFPIRTMSLFDAEEDHVDNEKGYIIGDKRIKLEMPLAETIDTINMGIICEFIPAHVEAREVLYRLSKFFALYIDPPSASQVNGITFTFVTGNRYPNQFPIQNVDINKPIRTCHTVTFKSFNEDGTANISSRADFWYWNLEREAYAHYYTTVDTTYDYHDGIGSFRDWKAFSLGFRRGVSYLHDTSNNNNIVYLRKLLATYDDFNPETLSYAGYPLHNLHAEFAFDYLTVREDAGLSYSGPTSCRPSFVSNGASYYDTSLQLPIKRVRDNWLNPYVIPIGNASELDEHGDPIPETTINADDLPLGTTVVYNAGNTYKDTYHYPFGSCCMTTLGVLPDSANYAYQIAVPAYEYANMNAKYRTKMAGVWSEWHCMGREVEIDDTTLII